MSGGLGRVVRGALWASIGAAAILLAGCASMSSSGGTNVSLGGSQEIPPVTTGAAGTGTITVGADTLTDAQYEAFKAGNLYVNVHSDANKGGEIRGQLRP